MLTTLPDGRGSDWGAASVAERAVQIEGSGRGIGTAVAAVETHAAECCPGSNRRIPTLVGQRGIGAGLGVCAVPGLGDLLIAGPGPGQVPSVDWSGAGVFDGDRCAEADIPLSSHRI